jgi:hypothetical protein
LNRADEGVLAWALADSATVFLNPADRAWLCVKIGAGEQETAIRDLLNLYANTDAELPCELAASVQAWIHGYAGSDSEPILRHIYDRISVSATNTASNQRPEAELHRSPRRLIAKRSGHARRTKLHGAGRKSDDAASCSKFRDAATAAADGQRRPHSWTRVRRGE